MRRSVICAFVICGAVAFTLGAAAANPAPAGVQGMLETEQRFLTDNDTAMTRMMAGMTPKPTGDVDRDFAEMMIPHHQGAIDMALAELRYGRNERLRRIAQEIIVDQQQEIAAMRLALGERPSPALPAANQSHTVPAAAPISPMPENIQ